MAELTGTVDPTLLGAIVGLGYDLFSIKLYWVAISAVWIYDYFLTLPDEIEYGWKASKKTSFVFWLYVLNRYFGAFVVIITLVAYFLREWTGAVCAHYGFMETFETMVTTFVAEAFLTLRVYALSSKSRAVFVIAGMIMLAQWIIAIYVMSKGSASTDQVALLITPPGMPPPTLPDTDAYHACFFISISTVLPLVETWLCLSLSFDGIVFLAIIYFTVAKMKAFEVNAVVKAIRDDGVIYFFVLFASNFVWLMLSLYARPGLKFMHNQPATLVSCIMINRITLNLKRAAAQNRVVHWGVHTFGDNHESSRLLVKSHHTNGSTTLVESVELTARDRV